MTKVIDPNGKEVTSEWGPHEDLARALVREIKPQQVVDIGTHSGVSARALAGDVESKPESVVTIDRKVWHDRDAFEGYDNIEFRKGDSKDVQELWPDGKDIDILHIDGGHHIDTVISDIENWGQFVKPETGVILMHDVCNYSIAGFGPIRAFNSINAEGLYKLVQNTGNGMGIMTYNSDIVNRVFLGRDDIATVQWLNLTWIDYAVSQLESLVTKAGVNVKES